MSVFSLMTRLRGSVEYAVGMAQVHHDYRTTKDKITQRIQQALSAHRWQVYPNSAPESGGRYARGRYYSSLRYPTAAAAQAAFARQPHGLVYGRDSTPDGDTLIKALLQIDTSAIDGRVTGHGMAAIEAALLGVKSGEHIVASQFIFATTKRNLLELTQERGIDVTFVDGRQPEAWERAIHPGKTRLFFYEPVGNPGMEYIDTQKISEVAHRDGRDILVVADNSMTPFDQSLSRGADMVAFSTTKLLGLGVDNGGAIFISTEGQKRLQRLFPDQPAGGPVLTKVGRKGFTQSHRGAYAMVQHVVLSPLRVRRQTATAAMLVHSIKGFASDLPIRSTVLDDQAPALQHSSIFAIDLGTQEKAFRFIDALASQGVGIVNNFGSARTTVIHPGTTTQSSLSPQQQAEQGISPGLVRVSVGVERPSFLTKVFSEAVRNLG